MKIMKKKSYALNLALFIILNFSLSILYSQDKLIKKDLLIEEVRQLTNIIESSHPDPYSRGGGRIAFHRRLHVLLNNIPEEGMTKDEFIRLLRPFFAAIGDQHTSIYSAYSINRDAPGGVPFIFSVVEQSLYVAIPFSKTDQKYFGSILVSVEGIPIDELIKRFRRSEGVENDYFALRQLGRLNLLAEPYLKELIPEWKDTGTLTFELKRPSGEVEKITKINPIKIERPLKIAESAVKLPTPGDSGFLCDFIVPDVLKQEIAYLAVRNMLNYREAHEMSVAEGTKNYSDEELAGFSSATEEFRSFVRQMKKKGTQTLIIDLRYNGGGNYVMAPILIYFLYGKNTLTSIPKIIANSGGGSGKRYSELYFKTHPKITLEDINEGRSVPLIVGDIDFSKAFEDVTEPWEDTDKLTENPKRIEMFQKKVPTFYAEYQSEKYSGYYLPKNVLVLINPWTSSSGLDLTLYLYRSGATLIGTPSGQAPNSWGNLLEWKLHHSGIKGEVSSSFDIAFGDDPQKGIFLPVHHLLTYEKLKSYNFDTNAEFLFALELLRFK